MEKVLLRNVTIAGESFDKLYVIQDDNGAVIFLPLLWTIHACKTTSVFGWHIVRTGESPKEIFKSRTASENTIDNYVGHVFKLLQYVNDLHKSKGTPSVHDTHQINSRFLNDYLNEVLPNQLGSASSLTAHQSGISAYFNFLFSLRIKDPLKTTIPRKTFQKIAEKNTKGHKIKYISRSDRSALLRACNSQRDRLILRMGYEVGLRASENTGLLLEKHNAKFETHLGLLDLFEELDSRPTKQRFKYFLNGKYCKGEKSRNIYFDRELLTDLRHYYLNERKWTMDQVKEPCETLFVKTDEEGRGQSIAMGAASDIFTDARKKCPWMNLALGYHDLRHVFATELYHQELLARSGHETNSESAAMIVVKERLGHASSTNTELYIRMQIQMLAIEEGDA